MKIHYFQRYHTQENAVTSNTMLMLSRLYDYNADKFFSMMNALILGESESPEIAFELQVPGDESVPDAVISQKSFKIVVETKLYNHFDTDQLRRHLKQFAAEEIKVILSLDPRPMQTETFNEFSKKLKKFNSDNQDKLHSPIKHANITFEQLITAMEDIVDERDTDIVAVLDDFKKYCFEEHLIPDGYKWMRAIVAGTTIKDNIELGLYYDLASRGYSEHGYIGLYSDKRIQAVGKLIKIIVASLVDGKLSYKTEIGEAATEDEIMRIKEAIERGKAYDYNLSDVQHKYFIVDRFYETNFRKTSKNPILKSKFFNLAEMFDYDKMPATEKIAQDLNNRTWEEF